MSEKQFAKQFEDLSKLATIVAEIARDQKLTKYKPPINFGKGKKKQGLNSQTKEIKSSIVELRIQEQFAYAGGVSLERILKAATIMYSQSAELSLDKAKFKELSEECHKLTLVVSNLNKINPESDEILAKKERLNVIRKQMGDVQSRVKEKNDTSKSNYARRALKILSLGNATTAEFHKMICNIMAGRDPFYEEPIKERYDNEFSKYNSYRGDHVNINWRSKDTDEQHRLNRYNTNKQHHLNRYDTKDSRDWHSNRYDNKNKEQEILTKRTYVPPHLRGLQADQSNQPIENSNKFSVLASLSEKKKIEKKNKSDSEKEINEKKKEDNVPYIVPVKQVPSIWTKFDKSILLKPSEPVKEIEVKKEEKKVVEKIPVVIHPSQPHRIAQNLTFESEKFENWDDPFETDSFEYNSFENNEIEDNDNDNNDDEYYNENDNNYYYF